VGKKEQRTQLFSVGFSVGDDWLEREKGTQPTLFGTIDDCGDFGVA
jgi:hypothetical protein